MTEHADIDTSDRRRGQSPSVVLASALIVSSLLSVIAVGLALWALVGVNEQAKRATQLSRFNFAMLEVTQRSRVTSAVVFCNGLDALKADIRKVFEEAPPRPDLTPEEVRALRKRFTAMFAPVNCRERANELIRPLPPLPAPTK